MTLFNPIAAEFKQRASNIENHDLRPQADAARPTADLWLRQKSVDGQAVVRAASSNEGGGC